jgi:hypothetical protein
MVLLRRRGSTGSDHRTDKENTMPRMMRRAAVLGATAHVASKHGAAKAEAEQAAAAPPAPTEPVAQAEPTPLAPEPVAPAGSAADSYDDLMKLKGLLDAGVLTQAEFDDQKANLLGA